MPQRIATASATGTATGASTRAAPRVVCAALALVAAAWVGDDAAAARSFPVALLESAPPSVGPRLEHAYKPSAQTAPEAPLMGPRLGGQHAAAVGGSDVAASPAAGASVLGTISMARTESGDVVFAPLSPGGVLDRSQNGSSPTSAGSALALSIAPPPPPRPAANASAMARPTPAPPPLPVVSTGVWTAFGDAAGRDAAAPDKSFTGQVGFVLIDVDQRSIVERRNADAAFIPASIVKVPTALYAFETLGPAYRFATEIRTSGDLLGGVLDGDVYLIGSGDPTLDTADLAALAQSLADRGVRRVTGRFFYVDDPAFSRTALDPTQPIDAAYNPSLSRLNLNFNRVLFKWSRRKGGGFDIEMNAHAARKSVPAASVRAEVLVDPPAIGLFEHRFESAETEVWGVSPSILGRRGSRWLPVRRPAHYAATTFQTLAAEVGVALPAPTPSTAIDRTATPLVRHLSEPLESVLRDMLRFSTNLTAEIVGMTASAEQGLATPDFASSASRMSAWMAARYGVGLGAPGDAGRPGFVAGAQSTLLNHSGLATGSRMTPREAAILAARLATAPDGPDVVERLFPNYKVRKLKGATVSAKTGTMYFGRSLNGYLDCDGGRRYAFAILASDIKRRNAFDAIYDPRTNLKPQGGDRWLNRARTFERGLLTDWTKRFCR